MIMATHPMPPALRAITERLNFQVNQACKVGRFETYKVDLSDWNLSLTDANPCIWIQAADLRALSPPELANNLKDVVRERGWQNHTILLFVDGETTALRSHLPQALPTFILMDAAQQARIKETASPTAETLDILLSQISRSQLAPYETNKPVVGSQFFGRQSDINRVLQHPESNYLFIGIRRIGKTSLLKEIKRRMDRLDPTHDNQIRRLYIDCTVITSVDDFLQTLTLHLDPSQLKLLMGRAAKSKRYQRMMFDRFTSLHGAPITFFIDELDRLLVQLSNQAELFDVLRAASTAGQARFIMAGFRRALDATTDLQSPFYNLATSVRLGRLKRADVKQMILAPLDQLRVTVEDREAAVDRINRETASLPNYVQFYCATLLDQLDERGGDTISQQDLNSVYDNREFRDFVLDAFMSNTEPLERVLVYALVAENKRPDSPQLFSQRLMDETLKKLNLNLKYRQLDQACRSLEVAGIFNQVGRDFEFAVPLFQQMLSETRDVHFLLEKTLEETDVV
jgi:hypothetical protein